MTTGRPIAGLTFIKRPIMNSENHDNTPFDLARKLGRVMATTPPGNVPNTTTEGAITAVYTDDQYLPLTMEIEFTTGTFTELAKKWQQATLQPEWKVPEVVNQLEGAYQTSLDKGASHSDAIRYVEQVVNTLISDTLTK